MKFASRGYPRTTTARAIALVLIVALAPAIAAIAEPGFSRSVTAGLVTRYIGQFGSNAGRYLNRWQRFMNALNPGTVPAERANESMAVMERVNDFVNQWPWLSDLEHWRVEDYWATPAEMFASGGGDCEDYVIAKYFALRELGIPVKRLRLVYVRTRQSGVTHMVLAYYAQPEATPLILDNTFSRIVPATARPDLTPVYSFNDDDLVFSEVRLAALSNSSPMHIRQWRDLSERLHLELRY